MLYLNVSYITFFLHYIYFFFNDMVKNDLDFLFKSICNWVIM